MRAKARILLRQIENLTELMIPANQPQIFVKHCDTLTHMIKCGLQDFAIVVDCGIGVVEEFEGVFRGYSVVAQKYRQGQA